MPPMLSASFSISISTTLSSLSLREVRVARRPRRTAAPASLGSQHDRRISLLACGNLSSPMPGRLQPGASSDRFVQGQRRQDRYGPLASGGYCSGLIAVHAHHSGFRMAVDPGSICDLTAPESAIWRLGTHHDETSAMALSALSALARPESLSSRLRPGR